MRHGRQRPNPDRTSRFPKTLKWRFTTGDQVESERFWYRHTVVFNLGASEIAVVLVVGLLFLGPKMLPEIATALGKIIREFRKATADIRQDIELDDVIRKPLQELRDAATLPPEELKRRDEAKAAQRKAEQAAREEAERKERETKAAAQAEAKRQSDLAKAAAVASVSAPPPSQDSAISAHGTMLASPPPANNAKTLTPLPDLYSPPPAIKSPAPRLPPPPMPRPIRPSESTPSDLTVVDVNAQAKAESAAHATVPGRPRPTPARVALPPGQTSHKPSDKDRSKKG